MKTQQNNFALRLSVVAVQSAMFAMAMGAMSVASAEEPTVAELTTATSSIEVGAIGVSNSSAKFGEYNGLNKESVKADLDFDLRGQGSDENDTTRWSITGKNLGLDTREFGAEYGQQGKFRINFGYDEIIHNISDTYQTPYQGVGGNTLYLPSNWQMPKQLNVNPNATTAPATTYNANALSSSWIANDLVYRFNNARNNNTGTPGSATAITPNATLSNLGSIVPQQAYLATPAQQAAMQATAANDNALFQTVDLYTKRKKTSLGGEFILNNQWSFKASASYEDKNGLKPKSFISGTETIAVMPELIDENHTQFNLSANFRNDQSFFSVAYYGSLFRNNVIGMNVEEVQGRNLGTGGPMSGFTASAPSNQFHQLALNGGYNITATTKFVADASYSRNTQDQSYIAESLPTSPVPASLGGSWLPASSLNGVVVTKSVDLKLTDRSFKDLNLSAAYKYYDRNNQTPVNTYFFQDLNSTTSGNSPYNTPLGFAAGALGTSGSTSILANRALSRTVNQVNLDADYKLTKTQNIKVGYDGQKIERYCDGSWIDCASADTTKENTLRGEWRIRATDDLTARASYAYSERRTSGYNTNAWLALAPMANVSPNQAVLPTGGYSAYQTMQMFGMTAWGPMGHGYPAVVPLGTANPGQGYTANQWATALGLTPAQINASSIVNGQTNLQMLNLMSKAQWGTLLNMPSANISDKQLAALNAYFANGNKLSGAAVGTRNFLSLMPGQEQPYDGDRNRDKLRTSVNWQATDTLSLGGGFDFNKDNYNNTTAGLTEGRNWTLNFDGTLAISEEFTSSLYYTHEDRLMTTKGPGVGSNADGSAAPTGSTLNTSATSLLGNYCNNYTSNAQSLQNGKIDPCLPWATDTTDRIDTLGLNLRHRGLFGGKFDVTGNASWTRAVTSQKFTSGGVYVNTLLTGANFGSGATSWSRAFVPAGDMPDVTSKIITVSINGKYTLDKASAIRVGYMYQHLTYDDWLYANTMAGSVPSGSLPTNEKAPSYNVHVLGAAYIYSF